MNILHMKYAVEVAKLGSLNKAAETLMIAQPNISRSIKELEADLGITIFKRSAKGMVLTPYGEEFMYYAQDILNRIERMELSYKDGSHKKRKFSISVPVPATFLLPLPSFPNGLAMLTLKCIIRKPTPKRPSTNC